MTGFSDVEFQLPSNISTYHDMFESRIVTGYLEDYVDSHIYNGLSLRSRITFGFRVEKLEKINNAWFVHNGDGSCQAKQKIRATKLVVASGSTSIPNMPSIPDQQRFAGPIVHQKQYGAFSRSATYDTKCKHVAVLGAGKSSADMVYDSIKRGKRVNWIIRPTGEGPALFFPAAGRGRYKNSIEYSSTRLNALSSLSSFMPDFWLLKLFHGSEYGKRYVREKTQRRDEICHKLAAYRTRQGALPTFRDLESTAS